MKNTNQHDQFEENEHPMPSNSRHIPYDKVKGMEAELADIYLKFFDNDKELHDIIQRSGADSEEAKRLKAEEMGLQMQLDILRTGLKHARHEEA